LQGDSHVLKCEKYIRTMAVKELDLMSFIELPVRMRRFLYL